MLVTEACLRRAVDRSSESLYLFASWELDLGKEKASSGSTQAPMQVARISSPTQLPFLS